MKFQLFFGLQKRPKVIIIWPLLVRRVHGHSMMPVLPPRILVYGYRWGYRLKSGDIVIVVRDGREIIKRIDKINNDLLFVLGDHPIASIDSRNFGWIPRSSVIAKIFWPPTKKS